MLLHDGQELIVGGNFRATRTYQTTSAIGHATEETRKYFMYIGKSKKRWLVSATDEDVGHNIWVDGGRGSQGCGGATLRFQLAPWGYVEFEGPWCTNADALLKDTGVDVRDRHESWGVVAKFRDIDPNRNAYDSQPYILKDIIYYDDRPTLGFHDRIATIAKLAANGHSKKVAYYAEYSGGSTCGFAIPDGMDWRTAPEFDR